MNSTPQTPAPTAVTTPTAARNTGLITLAFVLLTILVTQAQPLIAQVGGGNSAHAGMVSQAGSLTVMTADAGSDDVLLVLEGRTEELLVYRSDRNGMQLQQRMAVPKLFQDARAMSLGR